ncbi:MAG TPA: hypothetical protein VG347_15140 [Verrucomicrobiae bacterium]|nr:hypothetical protein [Verrucomicrobiae bacterium]
MKKTFTRLMAVTASSFLILNSAFAQATAPILFPVNSMFGGAALGKTLTLTAVNSLISDGANLWAGSFQNVPYPGTNPVVNLYPNDYLLTIAGIRTPARFSVYSYDVGTNIIDVTTRLTSGPLFYFGTNGFASLVASNGIVLWTNFDGSIAISTGGTFIGDGTGVSNVTAVGVTAPFNISDVSVQAANGVLDVSGFNNGIKASAFVGPLIGNATTATTAGLATNVAAGINITGSNISGIFSGNASSLTGLNASRLTAGTVPLPVMTSNLEGQVANLALMCGNYAYKDPWLSVPFGLNTWFMIGAGVNEYFITNNIYNSFFGGGTSGFDYAKQIAPKQPYLLIDDGLFTGFDSNGIPTVNAAKWPDGFPWLANFIHTNGWAVGIWVQGGGGSFYFDQPNFNAQVFANYLVTNHVDYLKADTIAYQSSLTPWTTSDNTNFVSVLSYLRAAPYPLHVSGAQDSLMGIETTLYDSFRSTGAAGIDKMGHTVVGDIYTGGYRPLLQDFWIDNVMAHSYLLGRNLYPDIDPMSSQNWPDEKRHIELSTFFNASFQFGSLGQYGVSANYENPWSNLLSSTSIKIRNDSFVPYFAYTNNGVEVIAKRNTSEGLDVLLLNRNYTVSNSINGFPGQGSYGDPNDGLMYNLFTNYNSSAQYGSNIQYVFWSTNIVVDFNKLGLTATKSWTAYNAQNDGRMTTTNSFSILVPAASSMLYRIVPAVAEPLVRKLTDEKWFNFTNGWNGFPSYPGINNFQGNATVQLNGGDGTVYSNGMTLNLKSRVTYGVNGANVFSAAFGAQNWATTATNYVGIYFDDSSTPATYFGTIVPTNVYLTIPSGTKTIGIEAGVSNSSICFVNPALITYTSTNTPATQSWAGPMLITNPASVLAAKSLTLGNPIVYVINGTNSIFQREFIEIDTNIVSTNNAVNFGANPCFCTLTNNGHYAVTFRGVASGLGSIAETPDIGTFCTNTAPTGWMKDSDSLWHPFGTTGVTGANESGITTSPYPISRAASGFGFDSNFNRLSYCQNSGAGNSQTISFTTRLDVVATNATPATPMVIFLAAVNGNNLTHTNTLTHVSIDINQTSF